MNTGTSVGSHMNTLASAGLNALQFNVPEAGNDIMNQVRRDIGGVIGGVRSMIGNVLGGGLTLLGKGLGLIPLPVPGVR